MCSVLQVLVLSFKHPVSGCFSSKQKHSDAFFRLFSGPLLQPQLYSVPDMHKGPFPPRGKNPNSKQLRFYKEPKN